MHCQTIWQQEHHVRFGISSDCQLHKVAIQSIEIEFLIEFPPYRFPADLAADHLRAKSIFHLRLEYHSGGSICWGDDMHSAVCN